MTDDVAPTQPTPGAVEPEAEMTPPAPVTEATQVAPSLPAAPEPELTRPVPVAAAPDVAPAAPPATAAPPAAAPRRRTAGGAVRSILVGLFFVFTCLSLVLATTTWWLHDTLLSTDHFVALTAPLASDPRVQAALVDVTTTQVDEALNLGIVGRYVVAGIAREVYASDQFAAVWATAMSGIHKQLVAVLRGDNSVVQTTDGKIVVNLFPLLDAVFKRINAANVSLAGTTITAPTLSDPSDPAASRAELSTALGRQLSPTFGVVAVAGAAKLEAAQRMVTLFDALVVILFVLTALLALVTVALSRSRIRVVALLGLGGLAALLVARLIIASAADGLATAVIDGGPGAIIGGEIVKQVATTYREFARGILVISLVVAVVATALAWLVQRRASAEAGASGGGIVADEWLLGLAGLCVGLLALLFVDLTAASFGVVAIAYVIWLVIVIRWHRHATAATASGMPGAAAA